MKFIHTHSLSGRGDGPDQFQVRITGLAVDGERRLVVLGDREVKVFTPDGKLDTRFAMPDAGWSICISGAFMWIGMQGTILQVDQLGNVVSRIDDPQRLGLVTGVAVAEGVLLAADATHKTLHLYRKGQWVREVGTEANTRGFMIPNGVLAVAYDATTPSFVVAHPQKHRVERYRMDGELLDTFGKFGNESPADFGGCCNPTTLAVAPDGTILVSEKAPPTVKAFSAAGEFLAVTPADSFDPNAKNQALAADATGVVYASDSVRGTIEVFRLDEALGAGR
jgi:sugar lactone lactonase YvrE